MIGDRDAVIVAGVRTPFARAGTVLRDVPAAELARVAIREAVERAEIDPDAIDEVVVGNVASPPGTPNIARVASLLAKLPRRVPALTVSRNGASGLEAIVEAAYRIRAGDADFAVAAAVESMSAVGDLELLLRDPVTGQSAGETAEKLAREFDLSREDQDAFALRSHRLASAAWSEGRMAGEVMIVPIPPEFESSATRDTGIREDASAAALAALPPAFDPRFGTVTAGNSAPVADGAVALVLASAGRARALGLRVLCTVRSWGFAGCDPARMGLGPLFAVPEALRRAGGLALDRMDLVELHEAFAAQVLACFRAFESRTCCEGELGTGPLGTLDPALVNVNGGAIALGHPLGASGARMVLTLAREMERRDASLGVATACAVGGQGGALIVERA